MNDRLVHKHHQDGVFNGRGFFFGYELPKIDGLARRLMDTDGLTVEMEEEFFGD